MKTILLVVPNDTNVKPFKLECETYTMTKDEYVKLINEKGGVFSIKAKIYKWEDINFYKIKQNVE